MPHPTPSLLYKIYNGDRNMTVKILKRKSFRILMSNFLDIDFVIKLNDKKSRRFDLSEVIFKCE